MLWWDLLPFGVGWLHDGWVEHHVRVRVVDAVVCGLACGCHDGVEAAGEELVCGVEDIRRE